jgi:hypothetical protein
MTSVWVYPGVGPETYWIVKRRPFQYSIMTQDPIDGDISYRIIQGVEICCPVWESTFKQYGSIWGIYNGRIYEISDLFSPVN